MLLTPFPGRFNPGKKSATISEGVRSAPERVWTGVGNLNQAGIRSPDHPGCTVSLYRLQRPLVQQKVTYVSKRRTVSIFRVIYPEDGGNRSLRNIGTRRQNYTVSHIRRWNKNAVLLSKQKIMQFVYMHCNGEIGIYAVLVRDGGYLSPLCSKPFTLWIWFPLPNEHGWDYSLKKRSDGEKFHDTFYKSQRSIETVSLIYLAHDKFLGTYVLTYVLTLWPWSWTFTV